MYMGREGGGDGDVGAGGTVVGAGSGRDADKNLTVKKRPAVVNILTPEWGSAAVDGSTAGGKRDRSRSISKRSSQTAAAGAGALAGLELVLL